MKQSLFANFFGGTIQVFLYVRHPSLDHEMLQQNILSLGHRFLSPHVPVYFQSDPSKVRKKVGPQVSYFECIDSAS